VQWNAGAVNTLGAGLSHAYSNRQPAYGRRRRRSDRDLPEPDAGRHRRHSGHLWRRHACP
jgi:hypothetical protein